MTAITAAFGARATADEVVGGRDLTGIRVIVTGGASGIGVETVRSLVRAGASVTMAVRDVVGGDRVAADIARTTARAAPEVKCLRHLTCSRSARSERSSSTLAKFQQ